MTVAVFTKWRCNKEIEDDQKDGRLAVQVAVNSEFVFAVVSIDPWKSEETYGHTGGSRIESDRNSVTVIENFELVMDKLFGMIKNPLR